MLRERVRVLEDLYLKRVAGSSAISSRRNTDLPEGFTEYWYSAVEGLDKWLRRMKVYLANWLEKLEAELEDELYGLGVQRWEVKLIAEKRSEGRRMTRGGGEAIQLRMEVYLPRCFVEYWIWGFGRWGVWLDWIVTGSKGCKEKPKTKKEAGSDAVIIEEPEAKIWAGYGFALSGEDKEGGHGEGGQGSENCQDVEGDREDYESDWLDEGHVGGR